MPILCYTSHKGLQLEIFYVTTFYITSLVSHSLHTTKKCPAEGWPDVGGGRNKNKH